MLTYLNSPFSISSVQFLNRLIQGPLAGFSCAPFRQLFSLYTPPAYCVSEMISANDIVHKHSIDSRYLFRSPEEKKLCYQIAGNDPPLMANAAQKLEEIGADLIDINCGCPKTKIRKKGAGSALLEDPERLVAIVTRVKRSIQCPLTVKIRIQGGSSDIELAKNLVDAGADALIVHGRHWTEDYDHPCDLNAIAQIKQAVKIPVIMNGDIEDNASLQKAFFETGCDAYMISRAGTGKPWLFQALLSGELPLIDLKKQLLHFMTHLYGLAELESEHQAVLQSKSLVRYYFKNYLNATFLKKFYTFKTLDEIHKLLDVL